MKILAISIGSRGDIQPFLSLATILKSKGHEVICAFPERFRELTEENGFEFISIAKGFIELVESGKGRRALGGKHSGVSKIFAILGLIRSLGKLTQGYFHEQHQIITEEKPDRVIHNYLSLYPLVWGLNKKGKTTLVSPVPYLHPTKNHAHMLVGRDCGSFINRISYYVANFIVSTMAWKSFDSLRDSDKVTRKQIMKALFSNKAIYTISPTLFSQQNYLNDNVRVLGFHELKVNKSWQPDQELEIFLKKYNRVLLVTLGSMVNPDPREITQMFVNIFKRNNIPAVVVTALGGLVKLDIDYEFLHFVSSVPYDWILPKIHGVVHHGGSGTTHTTLKHACPSLVIHHIVDQSLFSDLIYSMCCGPKGISVSKVTEQKLESRILDLWGNPLYKENVTRISEKMKQEDFVDRICDTIVGDKF